MAWVAGDPVSDPTAGQELVARRFTSPETFHVVVVIRTMVGLDVIFRILSADGTRVVRSMILPVVVGLWASPRLGPITADKNETVQIINRNAIPTVSGEEVQASLFFDP